MSPVFESTASPTSPIYSPTETATVSLDSPVNNSNGFQFIPGPNATVGQWAGSGIAIIIYVIIIAMVAGITFGLRKLRKSESFRPNSSSFGNSQPPQSSYGGYGTGITAPAVEAPQQFRTLRTRQRSSSQTPHQEESQIPVAEPAPIEEDAPVRAEKPKPKPKPKPKAAANKNSINIDGLDDLDFEVRPSANDDE